MKSLRFSIDQISGMTAARLAGICMIFSLIAGGRKLDVFQASTVRVFKLFSICSSILKYVEGGVTPAGIAVQMILWS